MIQCPHCNAANQDNALFCEMCGQRLTPPAAAAPNPGPVAPAAAAPNPGPSATGAGPVCSTCGHQALPGEVFCEECGTPLASASAASPAPAAPPVQQPASPSPAPAASGAAAGAAATCPSCGAAVLPGEAFCDSCGASLLGSTSTAAPTAPAAPAPAPAAPAPVPAAPAPVPAAPVPAAPAAPIASNLDQWKIKFPTGTEISLPAQPEVVLGRQDAASSHYPDIDLTPHGALQDGVGRKHARIFIQNGQPYIEDLNSTNGTLVNRQRIQAGQPQPINPGDEVRLGKLVLTLSQ